MNYKHGITKSKFFSSRILMAVLVLIITLVAYSVYREKQGQQIIDQNIKSLEEEIKSLENKNLELAELIKYFRNDDYVEKEARQKLNMAKEGEKVVIVPVNKEPTTLEKAKRQNLKKNWRLWLEYFFGS